MNHKNMTKFAALFTAVTVILAVPAYAQFAKAFPAQITAAGTLTLNGLGSKHYDLPVSTTFNAIVPEIISEGAYAAEFRGFASVSNRGPIKLDGLLQANGINFWVKFDVEKPTDPEIPVGRFSADGQLQITISKITTPPPDVTWVLMKGRITEFGENDAFGSIIASAKINEWTRVQGAFTLRPPAAEVAAVRNYSCSFYVVTLANATNTELNNGEYDLVIEGLWNVYNVTCSATVVDSTEVSITKSIEQIVEGASGTLKASFAPSMFTLQIEGLDLISGDVVFFHVMSGRGIPRADFNGDRAVNILDIMRMAKAFRAQLGMPNYDFDLDVNSDFIINIKDITVAAQEFGQEY
jgi:hypothetical protein